MNARIAVPLLAAGAVLALTGCGGTTDTGALATGDKPIDTAIAIDRTAILHGDHTLAKAYKTAVLSAVEPTITRGGLLNVTLFGKVGARSLDVYTDTVPSLEQEGEAARGGSEDQRRAAIGAALDVALGLVEPPDEDIRAQLKAVTPGSGSDIARVVGQQVAAVGAGHSPAQMAVILTDGLVNDGDIMIKRSDTPEDAGQAVLEQADVAAGTHRIGLLRIAGIGATSGSEPKDAAATERLVSIWQYACSHMPAQRCETSPTP
jgi:hypothetical protein